MKMAESSPKGYKTLWRNCSLRAISPFPTVFSKAFYCRHVKNRACLGKSSLSQTSHLLDSSKLKEFADYNSKVDKNGGKFS